MIALTPLFQVLADDSGGVTPGWLRDFSGSTLDKQRQMVEGFVGSGELWDADPARAAGSLFVNVGSLFIPVGGEVAAGAKVVSVGARMVEVGGTAAEAADVASVAGRLTRVGGNALLDAGLYVKQTGLVLEAVSDRVAGFADVPRAATAGVVSSLREVLERVPRVSVTVERMATPDGAWAIPSVHMSVEHPASGGAAVAAAGGRHTAEMVSGPAAEARAAGTDVGRTGQGTLHDGLPRSDHGTTAVDARTASGGRPSGAHHDPAGADGAHHGQAGPHAGSPDAVHGTHNAALEHPRPEGAARFDGPSADVANRHPIPSWIADRLANHELPAWKKRILQGHEFNYANHHRYTYSEIRVMRRWRLHSYEEDLWITSRKHTQVVDIRWYTMKRYIYEIHKKYRPGFIVDETGVPLQGVKILEVPPQLKAVPQEVLTYAREHGVVIRDSNGRSYNIVEQAG
ncbi:hypothetical protein [Clavibacter sp. VKM Ac-2872]|uniref:hypothetical protein n=1 Tax=Clavibacter sp. VKM Ac-2872 TaxID=2783812 RepID=UPI00188B22B8|nr:hypothetical protein [Clavibacter sp. VKM Ac-2872]MBF4624025.1 hypothetical protein [Clavibacter sp. VKM Ac-2872]